MNLKNLTDDSLHQGNIETAKEEREVLTRILHRLRETERRRLYSKYRCQSLFEYAVQYLKYSSDQADRRIKAMRLLQDLPEIEQKISSGTLSLTNLALAQKLFNQEKKSGSIYTTAQKNEVLCRLENQTTRAAEKIVFEIKPEMKPKTTDLNFESIEDQDLKDKLLKVKGLFAHAHPNMTLSELLHKLCDQMIAKKTQAPMHRREKDLSLWAPKIKSNVPKELQPVGVQKPDLKSRAELKRQVWRRDKGRCRKCQSTYALQIEHIKPIGAGGEWTLDNLCLLCRSCNQRSAIEFYGLKKMGNYLK